MSARGSFVTAIDAATAAITPAPGEGISIQCYDHQIPSFVEAALQRLYGNLFSSMEHYRVFGGADNASTYAVFNGGTLTTVWLFRREKNHVQVLNEGILIDEQEVTRFAHHILAAYPEVDVIAFHAVQAKTHRLPFPHQRFNCLEDMVITLPRSADDYLASMGKATRSYIRRYLSKLKRDFPSFQYQVYNASEIDAQHIRTLIDFNHSRMAGKGKASINSDDTVQRIVQLAMECGMVGVVMLDGRVCAGTINFRVGDNYFLEVVAHDPAYNDYRLGTLCCFLTVCECIARGGSEYHLLWGQDEYKTRLQARQRNLDDLIVYRSRRRMLGNANTVLQNSVAKCSRQVKLWMRSAQRRDDLISKLVVGLVRRLRRSPPPSA
jgi:hypothetical protein